MPPVARLVLPTVSSAHTGVAALRASIALTTDVNADCWFDLYVRAKHADRCRADADGHLDRVQAYAQVLADHLPTHVRTRDGIDDAFVRLLTLTSPLHDIGKAGIPDTIVLKPGRLTPVEFDVMKTHTTLGAATIAAAAERFPEMPFLKLARTVAETHHERFDGTGYPAGLFGRQIPACGRIVALADVYDALTSERVYKPAMSHGNAKQIILAESGRHFDPDVVDAFRSAEDRFVEIGQAFIRPADTMNALPRAA